MAEQLALKKYHTLVLEELTAEREAINAYLKKYQEGKSQQFLQQPGYKELLKSHIRPWSQKLEEWANEPYERNMKYQEQLIHRCGNNLLVRSKSEVLIAAALCAHNIPFRYECELRIGDKIFYPDFTLRHPISGDIYYWEHFGMMDQPQYFKNAYSKLQFYTSYGIIPSIQLITTYETKDHPLDSVTVENTVKMFIGTM